MKDQLIAQAAQLLLPIAATLALAAGAWISASIRKLVKSREVLALYTRVERLAELVVQEANQTVIEPAKAAAKDGKLTPAEIITIQTQALARMKTLLGEKGIAELKGAVGDVHTMIKTTLEAKVKELKPIGTSGLLMAASRRDV